MSAWRKAQPTRKPSSASPRTRRGPGTTNAWQGRYCNVSVRRPGLPVVVKMRHDAHYVEEMISRSGAAIGRMIPIEQIQPNADQPRKDKGDLRGLTESVRDKGVLEPLLVRHLPETGRY